MTRLRSHPFVKMLGYMSLAVVVMIVAVTAWLTFPYLFWEGLNHTSDWMCCFE